jgi:hypothetical protein
MHEVRFSSVIMQALLYSVPSFLLKVSLYSITISVPSVMYEESRWPVQGVKDRQKLALLAAVDNVIGYILHGDFFNADELLLVVLTGRNFCFLVD